MISCSRAVLYWSNRQWRSVIYRRRRPSTGLADLSAAVGPEESENSFQKSCPSRAAAGCATCEAKVPIPGLHACPVGSGRRPDLRREPALSRPNNQIYGGGNSVSWAGKRIQPGRPELGVHIRSWLSYARGGRRSPSRRLYSPAAGQPLNRGRALRSRFRSPARRERRAQGDARLATQWRRAVLERPADDDNSGVSAKTWSVLCGTFSWGGLADRVPGRRAAGYGLLKRLLSPATSSAIDGGSRSCSTGKAASQSLRH